MKNEKELWLPPEERVGKTLVLLYELIAKKLKVEKPLHSLTYDCTCIDIALDVQEDIYRTYQVVFSEEYIQNPSDFNAGVSMMLVRSGPRADKTLGSGMVRVRNGFLCDDALVPLENTYLN